MSGVIAEALLEYVVPHVVEALVVAVARGALGAVGRCAERGEATPTRPSPLREAVAESIPRPIARSQLPGRIRLAVPGLRDDPAAAAHVLDRVRSLPGIRGATANPLTGNALVLYDPARASAATILGVMGADAAH